MKVARWRTIITLMGLLAGIGGCAEGITGNSAINPSDVKDTTLGNDSGHERLTPPCILAVPKELNFGGKLCQWT